MTLTTPFHPPEIREKSRVKFDSASVLPKGMKPSLLAINRHIAPTIYEYILKSRVSRQIGTNA